LLQLLDYDYSPMREYLTFFEQNKKLQKILNEFKISIDIFL